MVLRPDEEAGKGIAERPSYPYMLVMEVVDAHAPERYIAEYLYSRNIKGAYYVRET